MTDTTFTQSRSSAGKHAVADHATITSGGAHTHRRISWVAIFGGVMLVVSIQLLLSLLGAGIGLGTIDTNSGNTPNASSLGMGAGLWWVVSSCLALFVGGYVAAWLAGIELTFDGMLHGAIAWSLSTVITFWLLTSAIGGVIGGGFSALSGITSAAGSGVGQLAAPLAQAAGMTPDMIQQQAQNFLQPSNTDPATMSAQDAQKAIVKNLATIAGGGTDAAAAKDQTITIMAAQMKISREDAVKRFDQAQAKLVQARNQAVQMAKDAADASASAASKTSFAAFGVLLLGLLAASIGGSLAVQRRMVLTRSRLPENLVAV